jgi:hypothetical protein
MGMSGCSGLIGFVYRKSSNYSHIGYHWSHASRRSLWWRRYSQGLVTGGCPCLAADQADRTWAWVIAQPAVP